MKSFCATTFIDWAFKNGEIRKYALKNENIAKYAKICTIKTFVI